MESVQGGFPGGMVKLNGSAVTAPPVALNTPVTVRSDMCARACSVIRTELTDESSALIIIVTAKPSELRCEWRGQNRVAPEVLAVRQQDDWCQTRKRTSVGHEKVELPSVYDLRPHQEWQAVASLITDAHQAAKDVRLVLVIPKVVVGCRVMRLR